MLQRWVTGAAGKENRSTAEGIGLKVYEFERGGKRYVLGYRSSYQPRLGRSGRDMLTHYRLRERDTNELVGKGSVWSTEDAAVDAAIEDAFA
jgi:hypothetical protein